MTMTTGSNDSDTGNTVTEHRIEAADGLVRSTMVDQASDLEHGWREAFQNIVDSAATEGRLEYTHEYTLVADNGTGVELTNERGVDLLTNMGETSKDSDDHDTVGEFGIGKGQINAKGQALWVSGNQALLFDIKGMGMTVKQVPVNKAESVARSHDSEWAELIEEQFGNITNYDGLAILVKHYEDEVPEKGSYKWDRYESRLKDRFAYLNSVRDTELYVEDELITDNAVESVVSGGNTTHVETFNTDETGDVHIAVKHNSSQALEVYSGGIYIKDIDNRGLAGAVVTEKNLQLNFARNEIKSGCPIWDVVSDRLNEIRGTVFNQVQSDRLNSSARTFIASQIFDNGEINKFGTEEIFRTTNEDFVSFNTVQEHNEIGIAPVSSKAADALTEAFSETVLDEHDTPVEKLVEARKENDKFSADGSFPELPGDFDAGKEAIEKGLHVDYEDVSEQDLSPSQMNRLGIARIIADAAGVGLDIKYGKSDAAKAWTDGRTFIKITDSVDDGGRWTQWVPMLWLTLIHEVAHKYGDKDDASHGRSFNRRFREEVEDNQTVLAMVMGIISENGVKTVAESGNDGDGIDDFLN